VGNGTTENQTIPVKVLSDVSSMSFGANHSAAMTTKGELYCWGDNEKGQVGNGTTENQLTPVKVIGKKSSDSTDSSTDISSNADSDDDSSVDKALPKLIIVATVPLLVISGVMALKEWLRSR
jgi:serine/threonine-protein kinase